MDLWREDVPFGFWFFSFFVISVVVYNWQQRIPEHQALDHIEKYGTYSP